MNKDNKKAFLFSGIGQPYSKCMDKLNSSQKQMLDDYFQIIKDEIEIDLKEYIQTKKDCTEQDELCEWLLIYTCECIIYDSYIKNHIIPSILVGYSMGLVPAFVCAGSVTFVDGIKLVYYSYQYPRLSKRDNEGMAAIIGLKYSDVYEMIEDSGLEDYVEISGENNATCIIISGLKSAVEVIVRLAEESTSLKSKILNSPFAFHSKYGKIGIESFREFVNQIDVQEPKIPMLSSFTVEFINNKTQIRQELIKNMYASIRWKDSILRLNSLGFQQFFEIALTDDVSKMSKVINLNNIFYTFDNVSLS